MSNISMDVFHMVMPRYFRVLDSARSIDNVVLRLEEKLGVRVSKVWWCSDFIAIPGYIPISSLNGLEAAIHEHGIFPMDASSGVAAKLLLAKSTMPVDVKVLDLCCCPGGKFCMLADEIAGRLLCCGKDRAVGSSTAQPLVVGVDIAKQRLQVCKSVVSKLAMLRRASGASSSSCSVRKLLLEADGTAVGNDAVSSVVYDSRLLERELRMEELKARGLSERRALGGAMHGAEGLDAEPASTGAATSAPSTRKCFTNKSARKREARHLDDVLLFDIGGRERVTAAVGAGAEGGKRSKGPAACSCAEDNAPTLVDLEDFDFVLVDAQCTHDASYRHLDVRPARAPAADSRKQWVKTDNTLRSLLGQEDGRAGGEGGGPCGACPLEGADAEALLASELQKLQRRLLLRAFALMGCSEGSGRERSFIYSTCSMKREQNEDVVQWLLDAVNNGAHGGVGFRVELVPITAADMAELGHPAAQTGPASGGGLDRKLTQSLKDPQSGRVVETVRALLEFSHSDEEFCRVIRDGVAATQAAEGAGDQGGAVSVHPLLRQVAADICAGVAAEPVCRFEPSDLLPGTVRLNRFSSGTSGLFIAKLRKVKSCQKETS